MLDDLKSWWAESPTPIRVFALGLVMLLIVAAIL